MITSLFRMISYFWSECILNYAEKKIIDPLYLRNSRPYDEPYIEGLPKVLQWVYVGILLTIAPFVMFTVFSLPSNYPLVLRPFALYIAILVTLWALAGYAKFALAKISKENSNA
jgi:hypothetical protein